MKVIKIRSQVFIMVMKDFSLQVGHCSADLMALTERIGYV